MPAARRTGLAGALFLAGGLATASANALEFQAVNCSPSKITLMVYDGADIARIVPSSFVADLPSDRTASLRCTGEACAVRLISSGTTLDEQNNDVFFETRSGDAVRSDVTFFRRDRWMWRPGIDCLTAR